METGARHEGGGDLDESRLILSLLNEFLHAENRKKKK